MVVRRRLMLVMLVVLLVLVFFVLFILVHMPLVPLLIHLMFQIRKGIMCVLSAIFLILFPPLIVFQRLFEVWCSLFEEVQ